MIVALLAPAWAGGATGVWPGQALGVALVAAFVLVGVPVMLYTMRGGPTGRN